MIYQNDKDANPTIRNYGCNYYSLLTGLYEAFPRLGTLTHEAAYSFFQKELENNHKDIRSDCLLEAPQALCDDLLGPGVVRFLGMYDADFNPLYKAIPLTNKVPNNTDIVLQYWVTSQGKTHFTLAAKGKPTITAYDPWSPASPWRLNGKLTGYRIYRILNGGK